MDWKRKLSSRKFWCAMLAFVTPLLAMLDLSEDTIAQVILILTAVSSLLIYILAESYVDHEKKDNDWK